MNIKEKDSYLKIDGIFHKYAVKAVKQFQKAKGLKATGKVDEKTAKKLGLFSSSFFSINLLIFNISY